MTRTGPRRLGFFTNIGFEADGRHAARSLLDRKLAKVLEPRPDVRLEDLLERPRIDPDQGLAVNSLL
jgi:hypothetical protein